MSTKHAEPLEKPAETPQQGVLCSFELELLRDIIAQRERPWGAAVGQGIEVLRGHGMIDINGCPTPRGIIYGALESR